MLPQHRHQFFNHHLDHLSWMVPVVAPKSISCPNVMVISNFQVPNVPSCHGDFKPPSAPFCVVSDLEAIHFHGSETMISDHPCGATLHQLPPWQLGGLFFPKRWTPDTCPMDHMDSNGFLSETVMKDLLSTAGFFRLVVFSHPLNKICSSKWVHLP